MLNLKYDTNELIYKQKQTDTENKLVAKRERGRGKDGFRHLELAYANYYI